MLEAPTTLRFIAYKAMKSQAFLLRVDHRKE
jgi:hypothetical protein